jgi:aryl-alcohol dehydrogenase-like predicted oxidoreductase
MTSQKINKSMKLRRLGRNGPEAPAIGLGCMGMSDFYGPAEETESSATIHAALDAGITLLDTGDFYGMGHNEMLIREALKGRTRERVLLSVKFGAQLAIAWALSRGEDIVPLLGARRRERLAEALGALSIELTPDDLGQIEAAVPPGAAAGDRYAAEHMALLDSERSAAN